MGNKILVLLAVAEPLLADGITNAVMATDDLEIIAKPNSLEEAIRLTRQSQPRVLLICSHLLEPSPFQAIREIKQAHPDICILALVSKPTPSSLLQYLQAGVAGYLPNVATSGEVINAIQGICSGEVVLNQRGVYELVQHLDYAMDRQGDLKKMHSLSQRELNVLKAASKGLTNKNIAQKLFISERTVQSHLSTIFGKLRVRSRAEAVLLAWKNGWITNEDLVD